MKLDTLCKLTTVFMLLCAAEAYAGGVAGGGGPPAVADLQEMMRGSTRARVFDWDNEKLGLGVPGELTPAIRLHRNAVEDFDRLEDETMVQAINLDGDQRSYQVMRDVTADTILLIDRP